MTIAIEPSAPPDTSTTSSAGSAPLLIEVSFKGNRKDFFLWEHPEPPAANAGVVVEADRGEDLGFVYATGDLAAKRNAGTPHGYGAAGTSKRARRLATRAEIADAKSLREADEDARRRAMERVRANDLTMKLSDAEWQWDRKKLTLYFTAERRVDFRTLVRELASMFRTRIELKQIGVRDEAKRLDGIGRCGRRYCSSSWLPELRPVNLGVAKDQHLSLNPSQISGACGRLMCCLRYEHEFYVTSRKRFPKEGRIVRTMKGEEKIIANDIFRDRVTLRAEDGEFRTIALSEFREETRADGAAISAGSAGSAGSAEDTDETDTDGQDGNGGHDDVPASEHLDGAAAEGVVGRDDVEIADHVSDASVPSNQLVAPITEPADAAGEPRVSDVAGSVGVVEAGEANAGDVGDRKPHRRRGRRGGRRNRSGASGGEQAQADGSSEPATSGDY